MKLPNGFGSVYKLSGNRRNPWCARRTKGWNEKGQPIYEFIGYYPSRKDALIGLTEYNKDPYDLGHDSITFAEVYERWSEEAFPNISKTNICGYKSAFKSCPKIHKMKMVEIKLDHLQLCVDESGKNTPSLKKMKILFNKVFEYAVIHEIITADKQNIVKYVNVSKAGNPNTKEHRAFTKKEIKMIWDSVGSSEYMSLVLILIYTGLRVGELFDLEKKDVHLDEQWFFVKKSKTPSGVREVPIADKIVPLFKYWMDKDSEYLLVTPSGKPFKYKSFHDSYWNRLMDSISIQHRPHDTRHTTISLLAEAGVDERIIQKIVGHKGTTVTQAVYTHLDHQLKLDAINKI